MDEQEVQSRLDRLWEGLSPDDAAHVTRRISSRLIEESEKRGYALYRVADVGHLERVAMAADQLVKTLKAHPLSFAIRGAIAEYEEVARD